MSYDLKPVKKNVEWLRMGAFSWSWLMNAGVGLVVGQGESKNPGAYSYIHQEKGGSPLSNDGYKVSSAKAKMMAVVARGIVSKYRFINNEWNELSEEEREKQSKVDWYVKGVREDFLEKAEKFADWAETSGGFRIY